MGVSAAGRLRAVPRRALSEIPWLLGGAALAALLLLYLHEAWTPWLVLLAGALGALAPRALMRGAYARFPGTLRLWFDLGLALLGVLLASWATLALYPTAYWVFRWRQALALPLAAVLLGLALAALYTAQLRFERQLVAARDREAALREENLRTELRALQAQINPHFLFNALNALAELTRSDAAAAETLVQDLAHLLRYALRASSFPQVSLGQELEAVDRYLAVEGARLGERLRVEREVEVGLGEISLPGLLLQPLVENAVRHAVAPRPEGGRLRITARREGDGTLSLVVDDDGPGLPDDPGAAGGTGGAGGGLASVRQRLALATREAGTLTARRSDWGGASVELRLPAIPASDLETSA